MRVDDIDPQGKVSLSLASAPEARAGRRPATAAPANGDAAAPSVRRRRRRRRRRPAAPARVAALSFEDAFEAELVADLGDLGPGAAEGEGGRGGDRGRDRGNDRRPSRGRSRRR